MAKGRKTGGRTKGTPNKATADARAAIALVVRGRIDDLDSWISRTARKQPWRAADLLLRAAEYHIPKLGRIEVSGNLGNVGPGLTILIQQPGEQRQVSGGQAHVVVNLPAPA